MRYFSTILHSLNFYGNIKLSYAYFVLYKTFLCNLCLSRNYIQRFWTNIYFDYSKMTKILNAKEDISAHYNGRSGRAVVVGKQTTLKQMLASFVFGEVIGLCGFFTVVSCKLLYTKKTLFTIQSPTWHNFISSILLSVTGPSI